MVAVLALVLVLNTGIPLLTELKDRAVFEKVQDIMISLDKHVTEIASQGEGSQSTVSFEVRDGEVKFQDNQLVWEIETSSEIISPGSQTKLGNLIIASNANIRTSETANHFIMETTIKNDTFSAVFNKQGSSSSWTSFNTSGIIVNISHNSYPMEGEFSFDLNGEYASKSGTGYTYMVPSGNNTNLGEARVIAHMNTTFAEYDLVFTLNAYSDFIKVDVKNIYIK